MKNQELQAAVEQAVAESLPKTAGELLQSRLIRADEMEAEIINYKEVIKKLELVNKTLAEDNSRCLEKEAELRALEKSNDRVSKKIAASKLDLEKSSRDLKLTLLEKELEMTKESKSEIKGLVETIFKNRTTRENIQRDIFTPGHMDTYTDANGMYRTKWVQDGPTQDNGSVVEKTEE